MKLDHWKTLKRPWKIPEACSFSDLCRPLHQHRCTLTCMIEIVIQPGLPLYLCEEVIRRSIMKLSILTLSLSTLPLLSSPSMTASIGWCTMNIESRRNDEPKRWLWLCSLIDILLIVSMIVFIVKLLLTRSDAWRRNRVTSRNKGWDIEVNTPNDAK